MITFLISIQKKVKIVRLKCINIVFKEDFLFFLSYIFNFVSKTKDTLIYTVSHLCKSIKGEPSLCRVKKISEK